MKNKILILFTLVSLFVLIFLGYFIFIIIQNRKSDVVTVKPVPESQKIFSDLVSRDNVKKYEDMSDKELLEFFDLGSSEFSFIYRGLGDSKIKLEGPDGNVSDYPLRDDYALFCNKNKLLIDGREIDSSNIRLNFAETADEVKLGMIKSAVDVSRGKGYFLLSTYPVGNPVNIRFQGQNLIVSTVTLFLEDPSVCN